MLQKITLSTQFLCLCLLGVGCRGISAQMNQSIYIVNQATPIKSESPLDHQSLELRNCEGNSEHQSLASKVQVACDITIADQAVSTTSNSTIELSTDTKTLLTDQVRRTYQQMCEEAKTSVEQTDLAVPVGRIRTFTIDWKRQTVNSTISFPRDGQTYSVSYTYTLDVPHAAINMETGCTA